MHMSICADVQEHVHIYMFVHIYIHAHLHSPPYILHPPVLSQCPQFLHGYNMHGLCITTHMHSILCIYGCTIRHVNVCKCAV